MTYMLLLNCALKLVEEIILYYDARSKKHQMSDYVCYINGIVFTYYRSARKRSQGINDSNASRVASII